MVASVQNISRHFSTTIPAKVRIAEFDLKNEFFIVLIHVAQKVKIVNVLV